MIKEKERDMGKSKVTIKEIADKAGVSIATVSHVINRTRYVRPELVDKIEKIIVETGYQNKIADKERKLLVGRESTIVAVIPNIESTIYRDMVAYVEQLVSVQGYQFLVAITDNGQQEGCRYHTCAGERCGNQLHKAYTVRRSICLRGEKYTWIRDRLS